MERRNVDTYELIFETGELSDDVQDAIDDEFDVLISTRGRDFFLTLSADGDSAIDAAVDVLERLHAMGVEVRRMVEDLVTRAEIAERAGVTPQAVGLWARNERHQDDPFPAPYNRVAGGVWLWSEVNDWLARGHGEPDELRHPSRDDYLHVNAALAASRRAEASVSGGTWGMVAHVVGSAASVHPIGVFRADDWPAGGKELAGVLGTPPDASWREFGLAG